MEKKKTFIDFLLLLTKWRKFIIVNTLLVGIISLVISFLMPKWYEATAVVYPPGDNQAAGISSILSSIPLASTMGLGVGGGSEMTYMAILKSQTLARNVIMKYDLMSFYEKETLFETYVSFYGYYDVQFTEENMLAITYEYTDSVKVAEIVNYIVEQLGLVYNNLVLERAKRTKGRKTLYRNRRRLQG